MQKPLEQSADAAEAKAKSSLPERTDAKGDGQELDCPSCGGRGFIVQPGIKGNWSMPCPTCGPYAE